MTVGQPELAPIPGVTIREARSDEWAAAGDVVARAYIAAGVHAEDDYLAHVRDAADRARTCRVFVAVDDAGAILGSVTYVPGRESPYAESERDGDAGIRMLGVDPDARGRGVGSGLVQACIDQARADDRDALVLVTTGLFRDAVRIYRRLGFVRTRERDITVESGFVLRAYELRLREDG
jgi:ribosomal protein S18 acetylase RimI-like enzyme